MIGMPTQEIGGIMVRSLINPAIKVGGQVQINQADIQQQLQPTSTTGVLTPFTGGPNMPRSRRMDFTPSFASTFKAIHAECPGIWTSRQSPPDRSQRVRR